MTAPRATRTTKEPAQFIGVADAYRCFVAPQRETGAAFERLEQGSGVARQFVNQFAPTPGVRP
jgi:hypothetical protein